MEFSVQKSDSSDVPKKPRSVDLKSVYGDNSRAFDRKSSRSSVPDVSRRKRSRKEASLGSFGPVVIKRRRNNGLNLSRLKPNGFSSGVGKPEKQRVSSSDGVIVSLKNNDGQSPSISLSRSSIGLDDGVIIPKKPRGVLRQKKLDNVDSLKIVKDEAQIDELPSDQKKNSSDDNENVSGSDKPVHRVKGEKNVQCKRRNGSSSMKENCIPDSKKLPEDFLDDDLEQNAAWMLSSRFDPSCTGFSGSSTSSSELGVGLHGIKKSQLQSSVGADNRMLRPRRHNGKSVVRKRRHFYEVSFSDVDPYCILKQRIKVFWPLDQSWYFGLVKDYDPVTRMHHVKYDDRDEEWIDLRNERFKLLLFPSEILSKRKQKGKVGNRKKKALVDNCLDNCTESEPIITWLALSKHRRKLSSTNISKKQRRTHLLQDLESSMLLEPEKKSLEVPAVKCSNSLNDRELSFVYFRKKFHRRREGCKKTLEELHVFGSLMELKQIIVELSLRQFGLHDFAFGMGSSLCRALFLQQFGKLMKMWPTINMEIVLVDSSLGLKFLLFEGSLKCAAVLLCLIISTFCQQSKRSKSEEMKMPFTSIGINLSGLHAQGGKKLLFLLYRFLEIDSSKWRYLENMLKCQCLTIREIPIIECASSNFKNIQNESGQMFWASLCRNALSLENFPMKSCDIMHQNIPDKTCSDTNLTVCYINENRRSLSPNSHSFTMSPSALMSFHIRSLFEKHSTYTSSQKHNSSSSQEFPIEDPSEQISDITIENMGSLGQVAANSGKSAFSHLKVDTDALSMCNDGDSTGSSHRSLKNEVNRSGDFLVNDDIELNGSNDSVARIEQDAEKSSSSFPQGYSSPKKSETGCNSHMHNNSNVQSQSFGLLNEYPIHSHDPTAPSSERHCNDNYSKLWLEDFMPNGFIGGSKKPRTKVSYSLPFGGFDLGSKRRSHHRKPRSYRKVKLDNVKRTFGVSPDSLSYYESLTCNANVLVTAGDKGWRECGAQVGLESDDQKDWRIYVKFSGVTKYFYKAQHVLQPGITNRHTHAMMCKGRKDWALEFVDRSQWSLFKELHEECYDRNFRASYVKNIPIPGVRLIVDDDYDDDDDDDNVGVPFFRSSSKYYRHLGTEVDMALDPAHLLYDMDSDDEKWVSEMNKNGGNLSEISDDMFERVIDIFEKFSYAQQCNEFSSLEIEEFMVDVGPVDVIKAIYAYWRQKRLQRGLPLIRQFQPPLWVQYQQQLKEWESTTSKMHDLPDGQNDKACELKKPPMFAFCLRPRGLEVPHKGLKQRSHKKFMSTGCHSSPRDIDGFHPSGRRTNGHAVGDILSYESSDSYHSNDGSDILQYSKLSRSNSKKRATLASPRDSLFAPPLTSNKKVKKNGVLWGLGINESASMNKIQRDGLRKHRADIDELKLRDASSVAVHALNMAKMKREKAEWLHHKADLAIHKATVALMIAESMRESEEEDIIKEEED